VDFYKVSKSQKNPYLTRYTAFADPATIIMFHSTLMQIRKYKKAPRKSAGFVSVSVFQKAD
jgi:hypothetical protein